MILAVWTLYHKHCQYRLMLFLPGSRTHGLCAMLGEASDGETLIPLPPHLTHKCKSSEAILSMHSTLLPDVLGMQVLL